jgi:phosphatidylglycerol---prolipoprotein diacylglyceryl transferase
MTPTPPSHWVHDLDPFLVRFTEHLGIRYYGLAYVLGFAAAAALLHLYARKGRTPLAPAAGTDLVFWLVAGVFVGGRLGYFLLYRFAEFSRDPLILLRVWEGGMSSHGGFVGVAAVLWWFARAQRQSLWHLSDLVVSTAPVGLFFGRVANFINGELWGRVTEVPWAVVFPHSAPPGTPLLLIEPRHPSQLYAAVLEGLVLLVWMQLRVWRTGVLRDAPGRLTGEFLLGYAVLRAVSELFREPDAALILGLSRGTFYSLFVAVAGVVILLRSRPADPA